MPLHLQPFHPVLINSKSINTVSSNFITIQQKTDFCSKPSYSLLRPASLYINPPPFTNASSSQVIAMCSLRHIYEHYASSTNQSLSQSSSSQVTSYPLTQSSSASMPLSDTPSTPSQPAFHSLPTITNNTHKQPAIREGQGVPCLSLSSGFTSPAPSSPLQLKATIAAETSMEVIDEGK